MHSIARTRTTPGARVAALVAALILAAMGAGPAAADGDTAADETAVPPCSVFVGLRGSWNAGIRATSATVGDEDAAEIYAYFPDTAEIHARLSRPNRTVFQQWDNSTRWDPGFFYSVYTWPEGTAAGTVGNPWTLEIWDVSNPRCSASATFTLISGSAGPEPTAEPSPTPGLPDTALAPPTLSGP